MIAIVAGKAFVPFKCTPNYLGNLVSITWLKENEGRNGFPRRFALAQRKTGYWKSDLDAWLKRRQRISRSRKKAA